MPSPDKMGRLVHTYVPHPWSRPRCHSLCGFCPVRLQLGETNFRPVASVFMANDCFAKLQVAEGFLFLDELGKT